MAYSERSMRTDRSPPRSHERDRERYKERAHMDNHRNAQHREQQRSRDRLHRDHESDRSDRGDWRDLKSSPSNGSRPMPQGPPRSQHSKPPTVYSEQFSRPPVQSSHVYNSPSRIVRPEKQSFSEKCSNLCSRRGLLLLVEILLNLLVLICAASTESASAGFTGVGGLGSTSYFSLGYAMSGFQGDEITQLSELDVQYSRMKMPTVYCAIVLSFLFSALALTLLTVGCMCRFHLRKLLIIEGVLALLGAGVYIIALALYVHFILEINGTDVCKQREALYNRRGYTSVSCNILGTEVAVCALAVLLILTYIAGAIVTGLAIKGTAPVARTMVSLSFAFQRDVNAEKVAMKTDAGTLSGKGSYVKEPHDASVTTNLCEPRRPVPAQNSSK